jgi:hypothetical protein
MIATGVNKVVRYKKEATWGLAPGTGGGQILRRVKSDLDLEKETYESNEIRPTCRWATTATACARSKAVSMASSRRSRTRTSSPRRLRKAWVATAAITGASITIAGAGPTYTVTRAAGSYLTDGVKIGDVIRLTAGAFNAANLNNNLGVVNLTATIATVVVLNGSALVAEGPIAAATVTIPASASGSRRRATWTRATRSSTGSRTSRRASSSSAAR